MTKKNEEERGKVDFIDASGEQLLACPQCGFEYVHITKAEVFIRAEDEDIHTYVTADIGDHKTEIKRVKGMGRNPSGRRDGLILTGYCEEGCEFEIKMAQHKGNTLVKSKYLGEKKYDRTD